VQRRGFSLIEVTLVILILGIMAGAVTLRMAAPMNQANLNTIVAETGSFDNLARTAARTQGRPVQLVIDLGEPALRTSGEDGASLGPAYVLPSGYRLAKLYLGDQTFYSGQTAIQCSRLGHTATYGLEIEATNGQRRWLLVAGLTGQMVECENEADIRGILDASTAARGNAG
jgi:prepilin-type N-terminal cleavage/methylation domain-containing protein